MVNQTPPAMIAAAVAIVTLGLWAAVGGESSRNAGPPSGTNRDAAADAVAGAPAGAVSPRAVLGAGSCTSSGCHAAAVEGHAPWQSSYTVWSTRDRHTQAHRVLFEPLAERIVAALSAGDAARATVPAHRHAACIGCHATGRGPLAAEGVSCESCHGPAGDWLASHALPGWRTVGNPLGMVDLADPFTAAHQCAGCHVGGQPAHDGVVREVSHDMIAAGHPRLAFELRSFKLAEPPHWHDRFAADAHRDLDDAAEKPAAARFDPLDEWALGRAGTLRAFVEQLAGQASASRLGADAHGRPAGVWPEFTAFDCYGCHRPPIAAVDRGADHFRRSGPLGTPSLEPMHWALLDFFLPDDAARTLGRFRDDVERRWWQTPDPAALDACLAAIDAARTHFHPPCGELATEAAAGRVAAGIDPARWDEAAAALAALTAIVDRAAARGADAATLAPARERLAAVRALLEFPREDLGDDQVRFDGPHGYDPQAVAAALMAVAASVRGLP